MFDMLKSHAKLAAERGRRDAENVIHWSIDIRKFVSSHGRASDGDAANGQIKVRQTIADAD